MNINTFLEKVSWKLHRVSFKVSLFTIGYYGDSSSFTSLSGDMSSTASLSEGVRS
jgi:hypothetical protein